MKYLAIILLVISAFHVGRFVGRMDGPSVAVNYTFPPIEWKTAHPSCAINMTENELEKGEGWTFTNLNFDMVNRTVTPICRKESQ